MNDEVLMRRALRLAARGAGNTSPNPMVGAIVAREGQVIGTGFHERAGTDHAESAALGRAGEAARGSTLYVTLEPCAHRGRTPPCIETIIAAGVARVVVAMEDPDERVRGRGIAALRAAGIAVDVGSGEAQARALNRAYVHHRRTGTPYVSLKMAQTINGKISDRPGTRMQLTGEAAAKFVRGLRYEHDAVMVGVNTVVVDDPELTVRPRKRRALPYTRIVVDSGGRIPPSSAVLRRQTSAKTIVATTDAMPQRVRELLQKKHIDIVTCARNAGGQVEIPDLLVQLGGRGVLSILCEGGPTLASSLLRARLAQRVYWLIAPRLIASEGAVDAIFGLPDARLRIESVEALGADALVTCAPEY